ncbi:MAG: MerR family DNA-binding transcriptional regulator [Candidatus Rokubacteria bacterium]|nr:MerR family DNA-binding transcriptional regulator [Candidatus Rokubacteria bacterium]
MLPVVQDRDLHGRRAYTGDTRFARRSGVSRRALRLYEARGILPQPERSVSGCRLYPADVLDVAAYIGQARRLGLTLGEIEQIAGGCRPVRAPASPAQSVLGGRSRRGRSPLPSGLARHASAGAPRASRSDARRAERERVTEQPPDTHRAAREQGDGADDREEHDVEAAEDEPEHGHQGHGGARNPDVARPARPLEQPRRTRHDAHTEGPRAHVEAWRNHRAGRIGVHRDVPS